MIEGRSGGSITDVVIQTRSILAAINCSFFCERWSALLRVFALSSIAAITAVSPDCSSRNTRSPTITVVFRRFFSFFREPLSVQVKLPSAVWTKMSRPRIWVTTPRNGCSGGFSFSSCFFFFSRSVFLYLDRSSFEANFVQSDFLVLFESNGLHHTYHLLSSVFLCLIL